VSYIYQSMVMILGSLILLSVVLHQEMECRRSRSDADDADAGVVLWSSPSVTTSGWFFGMMTWNAQFMHQISWNLKLMETVLGEEPCRLHLL
jgi:hypothetical protein